MDARVHRRFLEYRERFAYFAKEANARILRYDEFASADAEQQSLEARGDARDDEEEARFAELNRLLFRD